jgi:transcriptional regulator with XRE-family HTH domain
VATTTKTRPLPQTPFGRRLRAELDRRELSVRAFARQLRPDRPEDARRNLARWLAAEGRPVNPGPVARREVADALGVDPSVFADDDEEEDPWSLMLRAVQQLRARDTPLTSLSTTAAESALSR